MVGSIGVIFYRPLLDQLLAKAGIGFSVYKEGRLKDMGGFWRGSTPEEDEKFQSLIGEIYENFLMVVAQGRKLDVDRVRELATGEVFTGRKGQELGLVDEIGDFDRALDIAADLGKTRPRPVWMRQHRPLFSRLTGAQSGQGIAGGMALEAQRLLSGGLYFLPPWFFVEGNPQGIDP